MNEDRRPGFIVYYDIMDSLEEYPQNDVGMFLQAMGDYSRYGIEPEFEDRGLRGLWRIAKSTIDRDIETYSDKCTKNSYNGYISAKKRAFLKTNPGEEAIEGRDYLSFEDWLEKQRPSTDVNDRRQSSTNVNQHNLTKLNPTQPNPTKPNPTKSIYHAHGEYGWVKLTDEQYQKLQNDLGQTELDRCIQYVDESAQSTGNKNKWKDWNLVVRKCNRDGWGKKSQKPQDTTGWREELYRGEEDYGSEVYYSS